ncbi:aspartic peptidase domain-containing protein [Polychytrium aggregatum]|uniref:aspartic peptidase domain-containing protein n=1 Tax=Polychytrium aggregatum TaxID=110093 RepID=UPI0022FEFC0B|nr:aspartic peptidase domain-containing protein [Polychytrium aggregatum]KAI9203739.1 aspartic peptidase domain-containing protein [Polychytrium aggregatum]
MGGWKRFELTKSSDPSSSVKERLLSSMAWATLKWTQRLVYPNDYRTFQSFAVQTDTALPLTSASSSAYMTTIMIGTLQTPFVVQIDTGSSDLWVEGTECTACHGPHHYNVSQSRSAYLDGTPNLLTYGDGSFVGYLVKDNVSFGGLSIKQQYFTNVVDADNSEAATFSILKYDGLMGLALNNLTQSTAVVDPGGVSTKNTVIQSLVKQGSLSSPVFTVFLNPQGSTFSPSHQGELTIGITDASKYRGSLSWLDVDVIPYISPEKFHWALSVTSLQAGGTILDLSVTPTYAIVDCGTTLIHVDSNTLNNTIIPSLGVNSTFRSSWNLWMVDCVAAWRSAPPLIFYLKGLPFPLAPSDYILPASADNRTCYVGITSSDTVPTWLLGDVFLYRWYSAFDVQLGRVGLAQSVAPPTPLNQSWTAGSVSGSTRAEWSAHHLLLASILYLLAWWAS